MEKFDFEIDIMIEINRLNILYLHYRNLYRKLFLICCSANRKFAKNNRDYYKDLLNRQRESLKKLKEPNY